MDTDRVAELIEDRVPDARAEVQTPRSAEEDAHFAAVVVSPSFEGKSLVQQHQMVYDAVGDAMTTDIHALEMKTFTPEEYEGRER